MKDTVGKLAWVLPTLYHNGSYPYNNINSNYVSTTATNNAYFSYKNYC